MQHGKSKLSRAASAGALATIAIALVAGVTGIVLWPAVPKRRIPGLIALLIGLLGWCGAYLLCVPK